MKKLLIMAIALLAMVGGASTVQAQTPSYETVWFGLYENIKKGEIEWSDGTKTEVSLRIKNGRSFVHGVAHRGIADGIVTMVEGEKTPTGVLRTVTFTNSETNESMGFMWAFDPTYVSPDYVAPDMVEQITTRSKRVPRTVTFDWSDGTTGSVTLTIRNHKPDFDPSSITGADSYVVDEWELKANPRRMVLKKGNEDFILDWFVTSDDVAAIGLQRGGVARGNADGDPNRMYSNMSDFEYSFNYGMMLSYEGGVDPFKAAADAPQYERSYLCGSPTVEVNLTRKDLRKAFTDGLMDIPAVGSAANGDKNVVYVVRFVTNNGKIVESNWFDPHVAFHDHDDDPTTDDVYASVLPFCGSHDHLASE